MRFWGILVFLGSFAGFNTHASSVCEVECGPEAKAIFHEISQSGKSCVVQGEASKHEIVEYDRNPALGARMVKFKLSRSCELSAPLLPENQAKLEDFAAFEGRAFEAAGINVQKPGCFSHPKIIDSKTGQLDLRVGDTVSMGHESVMIDWVGAPSKRGRTKLSCEDLFSDPSRINVGLIYVSGEGKRRDIVRGRLSPAMGDPMANSPWITQFLTLAKESCKNADSKKPNLSHLKNNFVVKRFEFEKVGCLREVYNPFKDDGGTCAQCCLLKSGTEGGP